jgi:hypothetical protein
MTTKENFWTDDAFEDTVARALIATFESKVKKFRGVAPADRLTAAQLTLFRAEGLYIPGRTRIVLVPGDDERCVFDLVNDQLPIKGTMAVPTDEEWSNMYPGEYLLMFHLRRAQALGRSWQKRNGGTLFEMLVMFAGNHGIRGAREYFTVSKGGEVVSCSKTTAPTRSKEELQFNPAGLASTALQGLADRYHCWTITAQEKAAKAHIGCMQEEVKSLLYARSLPMSATGRKRPILHLIEAHRRRMRGGVEIDITSFLRGQQTVEIGGTLFKVNPPARLQAEVSKPSRDRYFPAAA